MSGRGVHGLVLKIASVGCGCYARVEGGNYILQ